MAITVGKIDALTQITIPKHDDILYMEADPATSKYHRKITLQTLRGMYNVMDYAAGVNIADGATDATAAIQAAIDAAEDQVTLNTQRGPIVYFPPGRYLCSVTVTEPLTLIGDGAILEAVTADGYAITVDPTSQGYYQRVIEGFTFDGDSKTKNGILDMGFNTILRDCLFYNCENGYYADESFGSTCYDCLWWANKRAVTLEPSVTMHAGIRHFYNCRIIGSEEVGLCVNPTRVAKHSPQIIFHGGIFEANAGFGVWAYLIGSSLDSGIVFDGTWWENNADNYSGTQTASVTVGSTSYDVNSVCYFDSCHNVVFRDSSIEPNHVQLVASEVTMERCGWYNTPPRVYAKDAASSVTYESLGIELVSGMCVNDLVESARLTVTVAGGNRAGAWRSHPKVVAPTHETNLWTNGSCAIPFTASNANSHAYSFVADSGTLFGGAMRATFAAGETSATGFMPWAWSTVVNKYYAWSISLKGSGSSGSLAFQWLGGYSGQYASRVTYTDGVWRTVSGVFQSGSAGTGTLYSYLWNPISGTPTVMFADAQMVEFDSYDEAIAWANSTGYARRGSGVSGSGRPVVYSAADFTDLLPNHEYILSSAAGAITVALADGTYVGDWCKITCKTAGNNIDITVAHHVTSDPEVIRLDAAKESVELVWDGSDWAETNVVGSVSYP